MPQFSRRTFLQVSGATALTPAATEAAAPTAQPPAGAHAAHGAPPAAGAEPAGYLFFNPQEAAFIEAAVVRLIPPDALGPSALEAGVPVFLDRQMAGAWGAGERLYRSGPWQAGTPSQGYQLPFTPAEMFRTALRGIREDLQRGNRAPFEKLAGPEQDAYLTMLQNGGTDLAGVPSKVFFDSLLQMTVEGYFGDPVYGGNRGMAAWAMIGFPGAYGAYYDLVDQYGVTFPHPPRSLAQSGSGHVHVNPAIPATAPAPSRPRAAAPARSRQQGSR